MDRCKHVARFRLGHGHSILNPQMWRCVDCGTTESVWACLKCTHVACGRYMEEHSLSHFQQTQHPLAMDVRELAVFCFACGDYVLNDNVEGDLKLLRGALSTVRIPGQRSLRSSTSDGGFRACDVSVSRPSARTALWHRRKTLLQSALRRWRNRQQDEERKREEKQEQEREEKRRQRREVKKRLMGELANVPPRKSARLLTQAPRTTLALIPRKFRDPPERLPSAPKQPLLSLSGKTLSRKTGRLRRYHASQSARRRKLAPGVTGLRNLGNTCYMNSILQVLSHLQKFRECFLTLDLCETEELLAKTNQSQGVGGGARTLATLVQPSLSSAELVQPKEPRSSSRQKMSLCHELHTLFRVMWSGRWSLVSPFAMLHSVWNLIPAFRGYDQQDAQEFLCELLDKVQQELESDGPKKHFLIPITQRKLSKQVLKVLNTIFHGQLLSQVTCLSCKRKSNTVEPFWDLSLEFPERYHRMEKPSAACQRSCSLSEMLAKFTETEALEGCIYACNFCNRKRRKSSHKPLSLSEACKQLLICRLPQVLRLHLKRFRWSGRNHREKIGVHVAFDQVLNIQPYCCSDAAPMPQREAFTYDLSAVVMHHGKGFGSGHYTAYCYNTEGGFWVHCNDSEMNVCSVEEVCSTQAYILFYTQRSS
ncbi:ubiquitin carboxyl-terminal hydrolase 49 [Rhinichthys klamathensis goyatoka]|uniref:ubiquitin carboxyl-terminal hydrolase 49 n=1 Tax=Rhinichthys klamathensis goyatoka TaxID=3034132 RepID=UPI0024B579B7|nr:ubiquitin carboxyl-terminal hydrolase 49 [Rhinichthys klamathensis goyatoka]XP_056093954.1 ubiquitin carboxyl-terminal hydrolase 49 [Rhinichthys klamathensis goyatoka]